MAYIVKKIVYTEARHSTDGKPHQKANYLKGVGELFGIPCITWTGTKKDAIRFETKSALNRYLKRISGDIEILKVK